MLLNSDDCCVAETMPSRRTSLPLSERSLTSYGNSFHMILKF